MGTSARLRTSSGRGKVNQVRAGFSKICWCFEMDAKRTYNHLWDSVATLLLLLVLLARKSGHFACFVVCFLLLRMSPEGLKVPSFNPKLWGLFLCL